MRLPETHPDARAPRRSAFGWLRRLFGLLPPKEFDGLDDALRRDVGLPRRDARPDAATLLDMSRPGSFRGGRRC